MRTRTEKSLKKEADRKLQEKYTKENPKCLLCPNPTYAMHHFIFKSQSNATRYYPKNLIPICLSCHFKIHNRQDAEIIDRIIQIKGRDWADDLYSKRNEICKLNKTYLKEVIEELI